jgi:pimeloyl-ACP methyl ester carboxylesterase
VTTPTSAAFLHRCPRIEGHVPHITTRDNVRLYAKDWGSGRPVILMHGWPLSADTFDHLGMAIANAGLRAIAYDRRGFGRSEQPWGGYDYDTLADDLSAVIDYAVARNAAIVGFSMGGGEVARYMSRHGGKGVTQAVLIASVVPYMLKTPDNPNGVAQSVFDGMGASIADDRAKFWTGFFKDFYGVSTTSQPVSDEVLEWSRDVAMQASLKATLGCAKAFASTDFRPDLRAFRVPTLIIHGTADKTVPIDASARAAARVIPDARLVEYGGAPHGLLASHQKQIETDVLAFLRG